MNSLYAISYYLEKALPTGGVVKAYFPKEILGSILPVVAKEKNCKIISIGGSKHATAELLKAGVLVNGDFEADVVLVEPDGMTAEGALLKPEEAKQMKQEAVAVGSISKWASKSPASHDTVQVTKTITELGIFSPEQLEQELSASSSKTSIPSPTSQGRPAIP